MTHAFRSYGAVILGLALTACAHASFDTPGQFAPLDEHNAYTQRATSAHGVVIAVREVEVERASLDFWSEAITQRMSGNQGYALIDRRDVRARSGQAGRLLTFGRDQHGHTFDYWVALFPDGERLVLMEMGGRRDRFEKARPDVERALASLELP